MIYCNSIELKNLTGSVLSDDILVAIIEEAGAEVDSYLAGYNLSGTDSGPCKSATLKLAQVGLLQRMRFDGTKGTSRSLGGYSIGDDLEGQIRTLKAEAYKLLDRHIANTNGASCYVRRVRGV